MHINNVRKNQDIHRALLAILSAIVGVYSHSHKSYIPISILVKDFEFGLQFLLCGVWYTPDDVNKLAWGGRKEHSTISSFRAARLSRQVMHTAEPQ